MNLRSKGFREVYKAFTMYSLGWIPIRTRQGRIVYRWINMKSPGPKESTFPIEPRAFNELPTATIA